MGASQSSISPATNTPGRARSISASSNAARDTPPALEIASAIGIGAVSRTGTALIRVASAASSREASGGPSASRRSPIATGSRLKALRSPLLKDSLGRRRPILATSVSWARSGRSATRRIAAPSAATASRNGAASA